MLGQANDEIDVEFQENDFVAAGFEDSIANMYFIPTGILLMGQAGMSNIPGADPNILGWVNFLWRNLLPVTIGNIIGGVVTRIGSKVYDGSIKNQLAQMKERLMQ